MEATAQVEAAANLDAALEHIDASDLRAHIAQLASDTMRGRPTPSPELDDAATYIATALAGHGVAPGPGEQRRLDAACGPSGETASNVIGMLAGTTDEVVLVTAHYDHVGEADYGDDRIYNGANDNASGVAALLEIADALARAPQPRARSIAFVAFCGEEQGLRGSKAFTEAPPFPLSSVVAVLNLEMLGHPDPSDARRAWVTGHDYSDLSRWLQRAGQPEGVTFVDGREVGPVEGSAFDRSDNYPFAQHGVVAHTIAAGPLDEHYHAVSDDLEHIDVPAMVPLVRALARATDDLARAETRPSWSADAPASLTRRAP